MLDTLPINFPTQLEDWGLLLGFYTRGIQTPPEALL
jgi:hypothetical protein